MNPYSGFLLSVVRDHSDKRDGEKPSLGGPRHEVALHPVLVLSLFIDDNNDVIFFESQLVFVVCRAVVQGPAPTPTRMLQ